MNKYALTLIAAVSAGLLWSQSASADVVSYSPNAGPRTILGERSGAAGYYGSEANARDAQKKGENTMDNYRANMDAIMNQNQATTTAARPPRIQPPVVEEPPKKKVRRELLNKRQAVNGIQGEWLPKKVWENDIDNNLGRTLLGKSGTSSGASAGTTTVQPGQRAAPPRRGSGRVIDITK